MFRRAVGGLSEVCHRLGEVVRKKGDGVRLVRGKGIERPDGGIGREDGVGGTRTLGVSKPVFVKVLLYAVYLRGRMSKMRGGE